MRVVLHARAFARSQAKEERWQQERATLQQAVDRLQRQLSELEARHNEGAAGMWAGTKIARHG